MTRLESRQIFAGKYLISSDPPRSGGQSDVYRAFELTEEPPKNVAIKILKEIGDNELSSIFFEKEVEALRNLKHPNIVKMSNYGQDPETKLPFLVLEWVQTNLQTLLGGLEDRALSYKKMLEAVATPLAGALAYAHERSIVHRDIKPSNVLVSESGVVLLADFGISKFKMALPSGNRTVAQFMSRPYAPPEQDSSSSYSRDVYAMGVLLLQCLTKTQIEDYPDISPAIDALNCPVELKELLRRCVNFQPENRPANGTMLLAEIENLKSTLRLQDDRRLKVRVAMTNAVRTELSKHGHVNEKVGKEFLIKDLTGTTAIADAGATELALGEVDGRHIFIYGQEASYRGVIYLDEEGGPLVLLIHIQFLDNLDNRRDRHCQFADVDFQFESSVNHVKARQSLETLVKRIDDFRAQELSDRELRERRRLFNEWKKQISAREFLEEQRSLVATYSHSEVDGLRVRITVKDGLSNIETGQTRRFESVSTRKSWPQVKGEVDEIRGDQVTIFLDERAESVPTPGRLLIDNRSSQVKIEREKRALMAVTHDEADSPAKLRQLIIDPSSCPEPTATDLTDVITKDLDEDKRSAVAKALGSDSIFVVQGPPGTGKTTFIAELVFQELKRKPNSKILITSQTNVALDNALERISDAIDNVRIIRLSDSKGLRVAESSQKFLLNNQLASWSEQVKKDSHEYLEKWCAQHGVDRQTVDLALDFVELAALKNEFSSVSGQIGEELSAISSEPSANPVEASSLHEDSRLHINELEKRISSTRKEWARVWKSQQNFKGQVPNIEDAEAQELLQKSKQLLSASGGDATLLRQIVSIQANWIQRLSNSEDFIAPLLQSSDVVGATCVGFAALKEARESSYDLCIIDEASKATSTEALVPMVSAKRWVMVGDHLQLPPFQEEALRDPEVIQEFDLDRDELKMTLFDRFRLGASPSNQAVLTTQRRMTTAIGSLVSECFYSGTLINDGPPPLEAVSGVLPKPVSWLSTSSMGQRYEKDAPGLNGRSFQNALEVKLVIRALRDLSRSITTDPPLSVLVLAPYSPQVRLLQTRVAAIQGELFNLKVEVNSVDAVQGRESDIVIFSVTRSNSRSELGFLNQEARINVAFSRARRALVVIGDAKFCASTEGALKKVVDHIKASENCALEDATE